MHVPGTMLPVSHRNCRHCGLWLLCVSPSHVPGYTAGTGSGCPSLLLPFLPPSQSASAALGDVSPVRSLTKAASGPDAESAERQEQMALRLWTGEGHSVS